MARTSIDDVLSLQDPAQSWNFDLFLPNIPGSSDTRDLTYKCMTFDLPGSAIDRVDTPLHGVNLVFGGRKTYTHSVTATFLESADWSTREKFRRWHMMRDWETNTGMLASQYKVNAQVALYNDLPVVTKTCTVKGLWLETLAEVPLDGGASNLVTLQCTFSFDLWRDD